MPDKKDTSRSQMSLEKVAELLNNIGDHAERARRALSELSRRLADMREEEPRDQG